MESFSCFHALPTKVCVFAPNQARWLVDRVGSKQEHVYKKN